MTITPTFQEERYLVLISVGKP